MRVPALRPGRRWRNGPGIAALGLVVAWVGGLAWFLVSIERPPSLPARADGIVALTGGADRVPDALRLLATGRAERMLVTGIGGGAMLRELAEHADVDTRTLAPRVTLGRGATSTHGNAEEAAAWVRDNHLRSLIIVTASYHMARAMVEMSRALPGVTLYAAPVVPPDFRLLSWHGGRLAAQEYVKLVATWLGLTSWQFSPGPVLSAARSGSGGT
ncbi:MAG: YdcF family protein [Acetobacteraceae bacterium]|nr:YdcF family protein [Acetobacteraceae bacterium]